MTRAIVLFGHGSRDPQWREPLEAVARRIRSRSAQAEVRCAFLELDAPDLETAVGELVEGGAKSIRVVPMFLGAGRHAREDLPRLVDRCRHAYPAVHFELRPSVGENARLLDLLATIVLE